MSFVAVAGRSDLDSTTGVANDLLSANVPWGLDQSVWELYDILGQPASVIVTGDDVIVESWYGAIGEAELRNKLDYLVSLEG
mgnify:FL=1